VREWEGAQVPSTFFPTFFFSFLGIYIIFLVLLYHALLTATQYVQTTVLYSNSVSQTVSVVDSPQTLVTGGKGIVCAGSTIYFTGMRETLPSPPSAWFSSQFFECLFLRVVPSPVRREWKERRGEGRRTN
jgi:hypothetical protein